ncbi:MAG: LPD7 domain-containing protein [Candidatus Methylumidiphilus sp.]
MEAHIQQPGTPVPLPRKDVSVLGPVGEQIEASRDLSDKIGVTADIEKLAFSGMTANRIAEALKEKLEAVKSQAEGNPDSPYRNTAYFVRHVRMSLGVPPVENEAKFNAWKEQAPTRLKYGVATVQPSAQDNAATSQPSAQSKGNANDEEAKRLASLQKADEDKTRPRPQPATDKNASADNTIESNEIFTASQADTKPIVPQEIEKQYVRVGGKFYHPKNTELVAFEDKGNKLETRSNSEHIAESMVRIAEARGWDEIKVSGSETFRREVWLEAAARRMEVKGYSPSEQDKAQLAKRDSERPANNLEKGSKNFRLSENNRDDETTVPRRNDADAAKLKDSRADAFRNQPPEEAVKAHPELAGAYVTVAALDKKAQVDGLDEKQRSIVSAIVREFVASNIERGHIPNTKLREDREVTRSRSNERDYSR